MTKMSEEDERREALGDGGLAAFRSAADMRRLASEGRGLLLMREHKDAVETVRSICAWAREAIASMERGADEIERMVPDRSAELDRCVLCLSDESESQIHRYSCRHEHCRLGFVSLCKNCRDGSTVEKSLGRPLCVECRTQLYLSAEDLRRARAVRMLPLSWSGSESAAVVSLGRGAKRPKGRFGSAARDVPMPRGRAGPALDL
mmetsp:Transcript_24160/g.57559  ORF Transcript_24160/g.57559 Transcript_24160/m.57559 type:complete len:204 (+) Transcript_24160:645-1256(+)